MACLTQKKNFFLHTYVYILWVQLYTCASVCLSIWRSEVGIWYLTKSVCLSIYLPITYVSSYLYTYLFILRVELPISSIASLLWILCFHPQCSGIIARCLQLLIFPTGSRVLNSGCPAYQPSTLPTKPSPHSPSSQFCLVNKLQNHIF